jgi:Beta-glucosidase-related glycosidases
MMTKWQRAYYQPNLPLGRERVTACEQHRELSKQAAKEGMVLLKNEKKLLPLENGARVALFGKASFDYVKGGGGSGDVTVEYIVNLYEGMKNLCDRVQIYEDLASFYRRNVKHQYAKGIEPGMTTEPELSDELCQGARNFADTAVIAICRFSGEGWDRRSSYDKEDKNDSIFEDGDFYLSHAEKAMVQKVKQYFDRIIVVLNVGGMVDTDWFKEDAQISSVLMAWQDGMEGGNAMAELLCGIGNPSGKLSDTFARCLEDYPSSHHFHESDAYVDYTEDIYVGYRYFETIPEAYDKVNYPFGYGLSYTTFQWEPVSVKEAEDKVTVQVKVTNTGDRAGKEVIQIYSGAPQGLLGKPAKNLVAFKKTRLLQTGETELLTLVFSVSSMASYDDLGKVCKSAWLLEKGSYHFYAGTSVRDVKKLDFVYQLEETKILEQLTPKIVPSALKQRMLADGSYEQLPQRETGDPDECGLERMPKEPIDGLSPAYRSVKGVLLWSWRYKEGIRPFTEVAEGTMTTEEFIRQLTDEELAHLLGGQPNSGVANTFGIGNMPEYGIPNIMTADGPAGLRIEPQCGVNTTAWPCSTLLACTWNPELVYAVGEAGAREVKENNISVWLTPAINIHRSPLCGRNFEYYSEDPLLTGVLASSMVKGIQSQHIAATVKHFALNNKETNRKNSDSRVSERAAREIYLKAFEIIVKTASPWCIMTSYNIINGHRASENQELIDGILRGEWGFDGMVTTDWWTLGEHYKEVKAGNDLKMACGLPERLIEAKEKGLLSREEMEACGKRILELILKIE